MRVLGIDPGLTRCGWGVVDVGRDRRAAFVAVGVFRTDPELAVERRLLGIGTGLDEVLDEFAPEGRRGRAGVSPSTTSAP